MIREAHDPRNKSQLKVQYHSSAERDILSLKNAYMAPMCLFLAQETDLQIAN